MPNDFLAFLSWYLATSLAAVVAWPLAFRLFSFLPDKGYSLARPLGLLATTYIFWLFGSLGFLRNDGASVLIAALGVLVLGAFWLRRDGLAQLREWLAEHRMYVLGVEAVFLLAFAVWAWVRAHNPEILGTEKPMEFMFINSILRSESFPPNDAWLAGHPISYYYYGYMLMAALIKVTGVASAVAFNLGIALLFALACTGALGVAVNLIALTKDQPRRLQASFGPALLAPLFIVVAGNFYGVIALAHANGLAAGLQIPTAYYSFGTPQAGVQPQFLSDFAEPPGARFGLVNVYNWLDLKPANSLNVPPQPRLDTPFYWPLDNWFFAARVTHDKNLTGQEVEAITEVPAFSFILGDMHPHVLGLPFVFLALALALNWMLWAVALPRREAAEPDETVRPWHLQLRETLTVLFQPVLAQIVFTGWLLGGLSFMNTWDFPMYLFVVVASLAVGLGLAWGWDGALKNWAVLAAFAVAVVLLGVVLFLPFYFTFQSQAGGILPNLIYPTRFQQTVVMFAHVLVGAVMVLVWLAWRGRGLFDRRAAWWAGGGLLAGLILVAAALTLGAMLNSSLVTFVEDAIRPLALSEAFGLMFQRRLIDSFTSLLTAAMVGLSVGLGVGALRTKQYALRNQFFQPPTLFILILLLTGAMLILGPEFVYLRDGFGTRMNTIFKFYFQAWVMWGLASAFGLWLIPQHARLSIAYTALSIMSVAVAASLVYTLAGTYSKAGRFAGAATLDGLAYFKNSYPNELAAINWLNANVAGTPRVMEAVGGSYSEYGRISMGTGLPTVIGWPWHEWQWRGPRYFDEHGAGREELVRQFYQARDWEATLKILNDYDIQYVVVSEIERRKYGRLDTRRFEQFMRVVFTAGDLVIYERLNDTQSR